MNYLLSSRPTGEILCSDGSRSHPLVEMTFLYYMVLNMRLFEFICVYLRKKYFSFLFQRVPGRLQALYC